MDESKPDMVRVLVPHDSGFASGGPTGFLFTVVMGICNLIFTLFMPWTWKSRIQHSRLLFPILERRRIARGEAPTGYDYAEYPSTMTLDELVRELGYDPQKIKNGGGELANYQRDYGALALKDIKPETVTEAISWAHVSHW